MSDLDIEFDIEKLEGPISDVDDNDFDKPSPSPPAGARKDLVCGDCGAPMELRPSKYGYFYGCIKWPDCGGTHGAHKDGSPRGIPANKATRRGRMAAHGAFDLLWKPKSDAQEPMMSRKEAYQWMALAMQMAPDDAHIGRFTLEQCEKLVELVQEAYPGLFSQWERLTTDHDFMDDGVFED